MWRFASHPDQAHINTVGLADGEEYILLNPANINGRMPVGEIKILYHGNVPKSWPLADVENNPVVMGAQP